jgi:hypothetical protein
MNKHNDIGIITEARQEPKRRKSDYQLLIAKKALGLTMKPNDKAGLLRLRAFEAVGRNDDKAR